MGIAPTDDRREIRSAYAARLKAIDPDRDPKSFITLREALEAALGGLRPPPIEPLTPQPGSPAANRAEQEAESRTEMSQLARMLYDGFAAGENESDLNRSLGRLLANPLTDHLDYGPQISEWLATVVSDRLRQSGPLITRLITRYGWNHPKYSFDYDPRIAAIAERARDLEFVRWLEDENSRLHPIAAMLRQHPGDIPERESLVRQKDIHRLLQILRIERPTAVWAFDPSLIEAWAGWTYKAEERLDVLKWRDDMFAIGMFFMPVLFCWGLLRKGHSARRRVIGFVWAAVTMCVYIALFQAFLVAER